MIIGENGAGKTTVAEALASLSFGEDERLKGFPFRHDGRSGHIALFEEGAKAPAAQWSAGKARQRLPEGWRTMAEEARPSRLLG